jgi:hypothetical protein
MLRDTAELDAAELIALLVNLRLLLLLLLPEEDSGTREDKTNDEVVAADDEIVNGIVEGDLVDEDVSTSLEDTDASADADFDAVREEGAYEADTDAYE